MAQIGFNEFDLITTSEMRLHGDQDFEINIPGI